MVVTVSCAPRTVPPAPPGRTVGPVVCFVVALVAVNVWLTLGVLWLRDALAAPPPPVTWCRVTARQACRIETDGGAVVVALNVAGRPVLATVPVPERGP